MRVLLLDDDPVYSKLLKNYLQKYLLFVDIDTSFSFEEAKNSSKDYDLYIIDCVLPDVKKTEHIEYFLNLNKKVILITGYEKEAIQNNILEKILDYVFKDNTSLVYLKKLINRMYKNQFFKVLIADDCNVSKIIVETYLRLLGFKNVFKANNGKEALDILKKEDINLVITDLNMPIFDGVELVKKIREDFPIEEIPILVISSNNKDFNLIKTLKIGANDFVLKPFRKEEFFIRLNNLLDLYDTINLYKTKMYIDHLTGAYNRLYLEIIKDELKKYPIYSVIMIDIDYFKKINDKYGHLKGDRILKHFVKTIKSTIRKNDYLIRYGGEEFLIILPGANKKTAENILKKIALKLLTSSKIKYTFSAGIADENLDLLEKIKLADKRLYKAKESGRNRIITD